VGSSTTSSSGESGESEGAEASESPERTELFPEELPPGGKEELGRVRKPTSMPQNRLQIPSDRKGVIAGDDKNGGMVGYSLIHASQTGSFDTQNRKVNWKLAQYGPKDSAAEGTLPLPKTGCMLR